MLSLTLKMVFIWKWKLDVDEIMIQVSGLDSACRSDGGSPNVDGLRVLVIKKLLLFLAALQRQAVTDKITE